MTAVGRSATYATQNVTSGNAAVLPMVAVCAIDRNVVVAAVVSDFLLEVIDMSNDVVELGNPSGSELVSDLLSDCKSIARAQGGSVVREDSSSPPGKKGEIITAILIGLATSAIYDLLKMAVKRMRNRPDFDGTATVTVDGREVTLQVLVDDPDK